MRTAADAAREAVSVVARARAEKNVLDMVQTRSGGEFRGQDIIEDRV